MKFRTKFGLLDGWFWIVSACVWDILWCFDRQSGNFSRIMAILATAIAFLAVLGHFFLYWEVDSSGLCQRRFWSKKMIAWDKVTRVDEYTFAGLPSEWLQVDYVRPTAKSGFNQVRPKPRNRQEFVEALHLFAPHAEFKLWDDGIIR